MRENFDYVTMDTYNRDTKELSGRAAGIISALREELDQAKRNLMLVLDKTGPVEIHDQTIVRFDHKKTQLCWSRDERNMTTKVWVE